MRMLCVSVIFVSRVGRFRYILGILKFEKDLEEILSMLRVNLVNSRRIFRGKGLILVIASFVIVPPLIKDLG